MRCRSGRMRNVAFLPSVLVAEWELQLCLKDAEFYYQKPPFSTDLKKGAFFVNSALLQLPSALSSKDQ